MNGKFLSSVFGLCMLFGCSENFKAEYYDSGEIKSIVYLNSENIPDGEYKEYYPSGILKVKGTYTNGRIIDTIYHFYENGNIMEKGLLLNGRKIDWWKIYDLSGKYRGLEEYIHLEDSTVSYKNQIKRIKNGEIDLKESSFFELRIPDTLNFGKNIGNIDYYSPLNSNQKRYLIAVVENQYSDLEIQKDTFSELPGSTRIGIYAHKAGSKIIKGEIIERIVDTVSLNMDSLELSVNEYKKYFAKKVFVRDSAI